MTRARRLGLDQWDLAAAVALAVGLLALHLAADDVGIDDPSIYLGMARDPLGAMPAAPFRFRVGTPVLVSLLPLSAAAGFLVVTWLALAGAALIVRRTAAGLSDDVRGRAAMGLFVASGGVAGTLRLPYATEPMSLLAGAAALELGRRKHWLWAGLALGFGALHRETTLFLLLPLFAWVLVSLPATTARLRAMACLAGPGAVAYLALHKTTLLYGVVPGERLQSPLGVVAWNLATPGGFGQYAIGVVLGSIGLLWAFLPAVYRRQGRRSYLSCTLLLLVPLAVGCATATDWPRVLGYAIVIAAPAVAVAAPKRILAPLIAGQAAFGVLIALDLTWAGLVVAAVTAAVVVGLLVDAFGPGLEPGEQPLLTTGQLRGRPGLLAAVAVVVIAVGFPLGNRLHDAADQVFTPIKVDRTLRRSTTKALERIAPSIEALPDPAGATLGELEQRYNCAPGEADPVVRPELRRRWVAPDAEVTAAADELASDLTARGWTTGGEDGEYVLTTDDGRYSADVSHRISTTSDGDLERPKGPVSVLFLIVTVAGPSPCLP